MDGWPTYRRPHGAEGRLQPGLAHALGHRGDLDPEGRAGGGARAGAPVCLLDGGAAAPRRPRRHAAAARQRRPAHRRRRDDARSEEHTSELQSLMRISYAVFCLKKKKVIVITIISTITHCLHTYSKEIS